MKKSYACFSYYLILSLRPQSERLRLNLRFDNKTMKYDLSSSVATAAYDNSGAHNQLRSMMARKERLSLNFGIDKDGSFYTMVESKTITPFKYQLTNIGFKNLFNYLQQGECDLANINPMSRIKTSGQNGDKIRTELMINLIKKIKETSKSSLLSSINLILSEIQLKYRPQPLTDTIKGSKDIHDLLKKRL